MSEVKRTKKDTFAPFVKMMRAQDKKHKTSFVPRGLNANSSKRDLENFYNTMSTDFSLSELKNETTHSRFLSNLQRQRHEELTNLPKKPTNIDRFKAVLGQIILPKEFQTQKKEYRIIMTHEYEKEYKENGNPSGRIYNESSRHIDIIMARDIDELDHIFYQSYGTHAMSYEDSEAIVTCTNATYEVFNKEKWEKLARTELLQFMTTGNIIIARTWLQYAKAVSEKAFEKTDGKCVYHQLSYILNNPPTGIPQQYIGHRRKGQKTNPEGLFEFFRNFAGRSSDYSNFTMESGVSTEMVIELCKTLGRSCYAYNSDNKCFAKHVHHNKNYCPIAFYKYNGHMFIIEDKDAFKSIAESNKQCFKIITSLVREDKGEALFSPEGLKNIHYIGKWDVSKAYEMKAGIYIVNQSNLLEEYLQFIILFKTQPQILSKEGKIKQISFRSTIETEQDNKSVTIECDANYGKGLKIDRDTLVQQCHKAEINYRNQGIGSIVNTLLNRLNKKAERRHLSDEEKKIVRDRSIGLCCDCHLQSKDYEYDHIESLSAGGTNDIDNFQILCHDCHLKKTTKEQQDGTQNITSKIHSSFNNIVFNKVIDTPHFKSYQFVEKIRNPVYITIDNLKEFMREEDIHLTKQIKDNEINQIPCYKIDMRKCRRNSLYYSKYEFPVYSVMDYYQKFSGKIQCGYFYVKTKTEFPLRGCGWYCEAMIDYCLKQNIINLEEILLEFIPSKKLPSNFFQDRIDYLLNTFDNPNLQKMAPNAMIGLWGIQMKKSFISDFTTDEIEASQWFVENDKLVITSHRLTDEITLYESCNQIEVAVDDNAYPLYSMVLQLEAIELHKLESIVNENNGLPLERNTDSIRYQSLKEIDIANYFWDEKQTLPKYQAEANTSLKHEAKPHWTRRHELNEDELEEWNISNDLEAQDIFNSKKSTLINGRAGTGKTYLVNQIIELIKQSGDKYDCLAPTNKSARLINGTTLDSMNYKSVFNNKSLFGWAKSLKYLIVDEISMVPEKFYRLLTNIKKINPKIIFYICGDFAQLEPVKDSWSGDYENSIVLKDLCQKNKMVLTKCRRSDDVLFNLCKNTTLVKAKDFEVTRETDLNIAYTHVTRKKVNKVCMERNIAGKSKTYSVKSDPMNPKTQDLRLIKGMPIICHRTNKKLDILNSDRFVIKTINEKYLECSNDIREEKELPPIKIPLDSFNKYFYLAYCITAHASQGETFKEPYTIYDWKMMSERARYVALSRGTEKDNIQIFSDKSQADQVNDTDNTFELVENVSIDVINKLLESDVLEEEWESKDDKKFKYKLFKNEREQLEKYKSMYDSKLKGVVVKYTQPNKLGRYWCKSGLTNFRRKIRNTLLNDMYYDFDISTCAQSLIVNICKKHNIECDKIESYVNDRERKLKYIMMTHNITKDKAKELFTSITYLANEENWIEGNRLQYVNNDFKKFIHAYRQQNIEIAKRLQELYPEFNIKVIKKNGEDHLPSFYSTFIQHLESQIVASIIQDTETFGNIFGTYEYDGMKILKSNINNPDEFLTKLNNYCQTKFNSNIKWCLKDTNEKFIL